MQAGGKDKKGRRYIQYLKGKSWEECDCFLDKNACHTIGLGVNPNNLFGHKEVMIPW